MPILTISKFDPVSNNSLLIPLIWPKFIFTRGLRTVLDTGKSEDGAIKYKDAMVKTRSRLKYGFSLHSRVR